jgi:hypothetical protein
VLAALVRKTRLGDASYDDHRRPERGAFKGPPNPVAGRPRRRRPTACLPHGIVAPPWPPGSSPSRDWNRRAVFNVRSPTAAWCRSTSRREPMGWRLGLLHADPRHHRRRRRVRIRTSSRVGMVFNCAQPGRVRDRPLANRILPSTHGRRDCSCRVALPPLRRLDRPVDIAPTSVGGRATSSNTAWGGRTSTCSIEATTRWSG